MEDEKLFLEKICFDESVALVIKECELKIIEDQKEKMYAEFERMIIGKLYQGFKDFLFIYRLYTNA